MEHSGRQFICSETRNVTGRNVASVSLTEAGTQKLLLQKSMDFSFTRTSTAFRKKPGSFVFTLCFIYFRSTVYLSAGQLFNYLRSICQTYLIPLLEVIPE